MTNPLDELREAVVSSAGLSTDALDVVHDLIDALEEAHPGLVDLTERCVVCRKPVDPRESGEVVLGLTGERVGALCNACAKEASATTPMPTVSCETCDYDETISREARSKCLFCRRPSDHTPRTDGGGT